MLIRDATDADWPAIHPFFSTIVAEGESYAFPAGLALAEGRGWWMETPPGRTVVAVDRADDRETVLGSAKMGSNRPGRGAHVATASFMVDPAHAGRGVGRALGEHVVAWARTSGYRAIQFNAVVETNEPAVRLWRSLGFRVVGTVPGAFDHPRYGYVGLHVMHLDLTGGPPDDGESGSSLAEGDGTDWWLPAGPPDPGHEDARSHRDRAG